MDLTELYQELIIDHGTNPRNHQHLNDATHTAEGFNPLCGDKIKLYLKIQNNIVLTASFEGSGCAISTASASMMTEMLIGKTTTEALALFKQVKQLLTDNDTNLKLGKLLALANVKNFPSRVKCATLAWHTLEAAMQHQETTVIEE